MLRLAHGELPMFDYQLLYSFPGAILLCLLYTWFYEASFSETPEEANAPLLKLSPIGERLRWRLAAVAMYAILLDILTCDVISWGIYVAIVICAGGYFTGDVATTGFGGYALTKHQQVLHRRWAIVPALFVFYRWTDFRRGNLLCTLTLSVALIMVLVLILIPEPAE